MEIENENQEHVTIEETAAECIERLKHELLEEKKTSESLKGEMQRIKNVEERWRFAVCDHLGIHELVTVKIQEKFDFMERQLFTFRNEIRALIDERIDEAKEEGQEIAKEKIQEMIEETLNNATFDTSIYL